jgi:hypothetical protein
VSRTGNLLLPFDMGAVTPIKWADAADFFLRVHYARRMPTTSHLFGLFEDGELVGAVSYGSPASPQVRQSALGDDGDDVSLVELNRLVITTSSRNAASRLVGASLRMLPRPGIVVSYADGGHGHVGYVYQATNFLYAGTAAAHDAEYVVEGIRTHPRTLAARGITNPTAWAKERGVERVLPQPKNRYVYLLGSRTERRALARRVLWPLSHEYPKGESRRYDAPNQDRVGVVA